MRTSRRTLLAGLVTSSISPLKAETMSDRSQHPPSRTSAPIVVFDVNETLLDFRVLTPVFVRIFGSPEMLRVWFNQVILYSEALTLSGGYADSATVGAAVLRMLADIKGRSIEAADLDELRRLSAAMPTYDDTPKALNSLREAGFRLVTLSNNPSASVDEQLSRAGIREYFAELHSIDDQVQQYKPARKSYTALATGLCVAPSDLWLVSCHAFDTMGAAAVGYRTALLLRPENAPIALGKTPDIIAGDLPTLVARLVSLHGTRRHE